MGVHSFFKLRHAFVGELSHVEVSKGRIPTSLVIQVDFTELLAADLYHLFVPTYGEYLPQCAHPYQLLAQHLQEGKEGVREKPTSLQLP